MTRWRKPQLHAGLHAHLVRGLLRRHVSGYVDSKGVKGVDLLP